MLVSDVKAKQPKVYRQWQEQPETVCPPQGETLGDAEERLRGDGEADQETQSGRPRRGRAAGAAASVLRHVVRHDDWGDLWKSRNGSTPLGAHRIRPGSSRLKMKLEIDESRGLQGIMT